jgi:hypothetical protein
MRSTFVLSAIIAGCLSLTACGSSVSLAEPKPIRGTVNNMGVFQQFIATRPTPSEFRRIYPDVQLVLPQDIATMEMRYNNSRYFAQVDQQGKIVGGSFR